MMGEYTKLYAAPFLKSFDTVIAANIPLSDKMDILNEILCGLLGHTTAIMYYMDASFYSAGSEKSLECLGEYLKERIIEAGKDKIQSIWLMNTQSKGEA